VCELTLTEGLKCARNDLAELTPRKLRASLVCRFSISYRDCKRGGEQSAQAFCCHEWRSKVNSDWSLGKVFSVTTKGLWPTSQIQNLSLAL